MTIKHENINMNNNSAHSASMRANEHYKTSGKTLKDLWVFKVNVDVRTSPERNHLDDIYFKLPTIGITLPNGVQECKMPIWILYCSQAWTQTTTAWICHGFNWQTPNHGVSLKTSPFSVTAESIEIVSKLRLTTWVEASTIVQLSIKSRNIRNAGCYWCLH